MFKLKKTLTHCRFLLIGSLIFRQFYFPAGPIGGQSKPLQTGRQTVCGDETVEESQLEFELCRLQRQLHVMEGDRKAYCQESNNLIRKQQ